MPRWAGGLFIGVVFALGLPAPVGGQAAPGQGGQATVSLGTTTAGANSEAVLPLKFSAPEGMHVGSIAVRIGFPNGLLTFVRMELGGLAESVEAETHAEVKPDPGGDLSVLHASLSTMGKGGSRQPIPTGPVAYVAFKIDKATKPETAIELTLEADLLTTGEPPRSVSPVATTRAQITVASGPVFACLFYMH